MNMFLKQVNTQSTVANPTFVKTSLDTQAIVNAGTTGNKTTDAMFDIAIKIASQMEESKRKNELVTREVALNQKTREYEAKWAGKNKESSMYYNEYISGIDKIYTEEKALMAESQFTTKEDVEKMNAFYQKSNDDYKYKAMGNKAIYDSKEAINTTTMNANALMLESSYETNPAKAAEQMSKAFGLLDTLKGHVGVSESELTAMKSNLYNQQIELSTTTQLNAIMSAPITYEDRLTHLSKINPGLSEEELSTMELTPDQEFAIKDEQLSIIMNQLEQEDNYTTDTAKIMPRANKSEVALIAGNAKRHMVVAKNKAEGIYEKTRNKLIDERKRRVDANNKVVDTLQKNFIKDITKYEGEDYDKSNHKGYMERIEGVEFTDYTLFDSKSLQDKVAPGLSENVLNNQSYLQVVSEKEAKQLTDNLNDQVFGQDQLSPSMVYEDVFTRINEGSIEQNLNTERSMIARGVISRPQAHFNKNGNTDAFDNITVGANVNKGPSAVKLASVLGTSDLGLITKGYNMSQKKAVADLIIGYSINMGRSIITDGRIQTQEMMIAFQNDPKMKKALLNDIKSIGNIDYGIIREVKPDKQNMRKTIEIKNEFADKTHRKQGPSGLVTDRNFRSPEYDPLDDEYLD
ncbi:MAG: hypothetical protein ACRC6A_06175 [Fusobacteriaceae bacterium]